MNLREIEHLLNAIEILGVIVPSFLLTVISTNLSAAFISRPYKLVKVFSLEFAVLTLPFIFICTILREYVAYINLLALATLLLITFLNKSRINENGKKQNGDGDGKQTEYIQIAYITNARSIINLITVVCILAVDFKFFPWHFHKTSRYGISLMDVGVGLYVYSNALVACEIRGVKHSIRKTFLNVLPILVIGVLRFVFTYLTNYHVNPQEYGVHWNFFITLAVTKLLSAVLMSFIIPSFTTCLTIGIVVVNIHQFLLYIGLEDFVFSTVGRDNLFTANREGIVSSLGYVGLYFLAIAAGFIMHKTKTRQRTFWSLLIVNLTLFFTTVILHELFNISRCLANSTYISWILLLGLIMTFLLFCYEQFLNHFYENHNAVLYVPQLFEAINYNGLTYFLVANLLTGFVNLSIETSDVSNELSLLILFLYMFINSFIVVFLYCKKIKLKL